MTAKDFLTILENHPDLPLTFEYQAGSFARLDFHLTEFKNVSFDTVDCGGVRNQWKELHVQIWENEIPEPQHRVNTTKALAIFRSVEKVRPGFQDVEIKFEYGNSTFHTAILPVGTLEIHEQQILIKLGADQTSCKAKDRATTPEEKAAACCSPVVIVESQEKPKLNLSNLIASDKNACTPGSGCC